VEIDGICSNPPKRLRRLLETLDSSSFSEVKGPKANAPEADSGPADRIPYLPRRHLTPHEIEELIAGYQAGETAKELVSCRGDS
jgi:hypothetical protein